MPYGLGHEPWDTQAPSSDLLSKMLKSWDAICEAGQNRVIFLCCMWTQTHHPVEALGKEGYEDIQCITWYKEDMNLVGNPESLVPSTEIIIMARKRSADNAKPISFLSPDPTKRHNVIVGPKLSNPRKYPNGHRVNQHEKPEYLARELLRLFCMPGQWVVVVGSGSGGDVRGALRAGMKVVAIDTDEKQIEFLKGDCKTWEADYDEKVRKAAVDEKVSADVWPRQDQGLIFREPPQTECSNCGCDLSATNVAEPCTECSTPCCAACLESCLSTHGSRVCGEKCAPAVEKAAEKP